MMAIFKQQEYIDKLHRVSTPEQILIPESRFIKPSDMHSALSSGDEAWNKFLLNQGVTKVGEASAGPRKPSNKLINNLAGLIKSNPRKIFFGGMLLTGLTNQYFNNTKEAPLYGLTSKQQFFLPAENRPLNGFDGMPHGGLASSLRKENTAFGSKYDRVRALAKMMGETFESFTQSKGFKESLSSATVVKELGAGTFGQADLMETTLHGEKFQFVRKRLHEGIREEIFQKAARPEDYLGSLSLMHEGGMMRKLGTTETVPSVYKTSKEELFMEVMPGQQIYDTLESGKTIPEEAISKFRQTAKEAQELGIENLDIHQGNLMFDLESGRASWIDWGQARYSQEAPNLAGMEMKIVGATSPVKKNIGSPSIDPFGQTIDPMAATPAASRNTAATPVMRGKKKIAAAKNKVATPATPLERGKKRANRAVNQFDGLPHGGMAATNRIKKTDHGSPWKGLLGGVSQKVARFFSSKGARQWRTGARQLPKGLQAFLGGVQGLASTKSGFKSKIGTMIEDSSLTSEQKQFLSNQLSEFTKGMKKDKAYVALNPRVIRETAEEAGESYLGAYRGVLRHERFHQAVVNQNMRESIQSLNEASFIPSHFKKFAGKHAAEEFLAYSLEMGAVRSASPAHQAARSLFKGEDSIYKSIEGMHDQGLAEKLRSFLTDFGSPWQGLLNGASVKVSRATASQSGRAAQKLTESAQDLRIAQEQIWKMANNAGKGHVGYAGSHVKQLSRFGGNL